MKLDRIVMIILSILFVIFMVNTYEEYNSQSSVDSIALIALNNNTADFNESTISTEQDEYTQSFEYTNTYNYPVRLSNNNIEINCTGTGEHKLEDEKLVESNFIVKAVFSDKKNGVKYTSVKLPKKSKAYIYVSTEYVGETYPYEEVTCDYNVSINAE